MPSRDFIISIDFDGTIVEHEYPLVGTTVPWAEDYIKQFVKLGAKIILNTCRSDNELSAAVQWFETRGIPLFGVNENPAQFEWTSSPKVFADIYIDDRNAGCPIVSKWGSDKYYVDWSIIGPQIVHQLKFRRQVK